MEQPDDTELPLEDKARIIKAQMDKVRGASPGEVLLLENPSVNWPEKPAAFKAQLGIYLEILDEFKDPETALVRGIDTDYNVLLAMMKIHGTLGPLTKEGLSKDKIKYSGSMFVSPYTTVHVGPLEVMDVLKPYGNAFKDILQFYIRDYRNVKRR